MSTYESAKIRNMHCTREIERKIHGYGRISDDYLRYIVSHWLPEEKYRSVIDALVADGTIEKNGDSLVWVKRQITPDRELPGRGPLLYPEKLS